MQWSKLNEEHSDILSELKVEWSNLISSNKVEEEHHKFIAKHSSMCWGKEVYFTISKLQLAEKLIPDFVLVKEKGSLGLMYTLVEIEKPKSKAVTKKNDPAADLTHATKQIRDWKSWIEKNSQEAGILFPSKFSADSMAHINYMIIVGRRSDISSEQELEKIKLAQEIGYEIRSFDFITDNIKNYIAMDNIFPNSDTEQQYWKEGLYHKFANPFYMSVTNKNWKEFVKSPSLSRVHMIGKNIKELNDMMSTNSKYEIFSDRVKS